MAVKPLKIGAPIEGANTIEGHDVIFENGHAFSQSVINNHLTFDPATHTDYTAGVEQQHRMLAALNAAKDPNHKLATTSEIDFGNLQANLQQGLKGKFANPNEGKGFGRGVGGNDSDGTPT